MKNPSDLTGEQRTTLSSIATTNKARTAPTCSNQQGDGLLHLSGLGVPVRAQRSALRRWA